MKIERLPSGSYRLRQQRNGQKYTVVVDHKPTKAEAYRLIDDAQRQKLLPGKQHIDENFRADFLFREAAEEYITVKSNILSPSTIREYRRLLSVIDSWFANLPLSEIRQIDLQRLVNDYSPGRSPKTVRNLHGFCVSVIKTYKPDAHLHVTLPQPQKKDFYIPTKDEISAVLNELDNPKYAKVRVAIHLAIYGLRRSEICALELSDIDRERSIVHVSKALVADKNGKYVLKTTKTIDSTRDIFIDPRVTEMIYEQGYVYKGDPNMITYRLDQILKTLGIPHFSLHKIRHFFASYMHQLGYSDKTILTAGGWKTDKVMKSVYRHVMDYDVSAKQMASDLGDLL